MVDRELIGAHRLIPGNGAPQVRQVVSQPILGGAGYLSTSRVRFNEHQFTSPATSKSSGQSLWGRINELTSRVRSKRA